MNRAQRRASRHKQQRLRADPFTMATVIGTSQVMDADQANMAMIKIHTAFAELQRGAAGDEGSHHHMVLACTINIGLIRAEQIDRELEPPLCEAVEAMNRAAARPRFGFDGPGLQAIAYALEVYEQILRVSSENQMAQAAVITTQRMRAQWAKEEAATLSN